MRQKTARRHPSFMGDKNHYHEPPQRPQAMKTDNLFYELFRQWPAVALDLAGLDPAAAGPCS